MSTNSDRTSDLLPFVVGVTGHRDLRSEDIPELERQVTSILKKLSDENGNRPLTLLSPLAEGADQLVARSALDIGARLVVPLPMRRELYEKDFCDPKVLEEFRRLLSLADDSFVVETGREFTEEEIREYGPARDVHYGAVGAYVVRHSAVVIALWNGQPAPAPYGTADIVRYCREGLPEEFGGGPARLPALRVVPVRRRGDEE